MLSRAPVGHSVGNEGEKQDVFQLEDQETENTRNESLFGLVTREWRLLKEQHKVIQNNVA